MCLSLSLYTDSVLSLQGGGQETTLLTAVTQLVHHGMVFVPTGYTYGGEWVDCCSCSAACHLKQGLHSVANGATHSMASLTLMLWPHSRLCTLCACHLCPLLRDVPTLGPMCDLLHPLLPHVPGTMFQVETAQGGSPYGAGCLAGPTGARQPDEHELGYAKHQVGRWAW